MRNILILCASLLLVGVGFLAWKAYEPERLGEAMAGVQRVAVEKLLASPDAYKGQKIRIEGTVEQQCPVSGCFFTVRDGDKALRAEFGATLSTLPQREGSKAIVEGYLERDGDRLELRGVAVEFR